MMNTPADKLLLFLLLIFRIVLLGPGTTRGATLTGTLASIPQGSVVDLTSEGPLDWVHWGLYTETSLDRKAGAAPAISDFTRLDATNGYSYVYQFADNSNGYSWSDGTPTVAVTNTTTGVWAYGVPAMGSGFQITVPADTTRRTLKIYVGAYAARGRLEAFLSDTSAPPYANTNLANLMGNGPSEVYSINYAAQSAGQTLTIKWTLIQATRADGNVTLQAAALSAPGANNPPTVALTAPADNAMFAAGSDIALQAIAADSDGSVTLVEFFARDTKIGQATASPFSVTWTNLAAGEYLLTARATDNGGASTVSQPVEIFVNGTGGSLSGATGLPPAVVDLTAQGTADWAHWGLVSSNSFDHKAGLPQQISNFSKIGTDEVQRYSDNFTAYSWSDGTPTGTASGTPTGVFTYGLTNGFLLTAPADTHSRALKVYVGLYGAQADFQAYLSDFSAPAYIDTSLSSVYGNLYAVYSLNYTAALPGQTLVVRYRTKTLFDADFGNVTLQAATLSGAGPANAPPTVAITTPANDETFIAPANIAITADASDTDGTISLVEFFNGANKLGQATANPFSLTWSNVATGTYTLIAQATDNLGATATSNPVTVAVATNATTAVTIINSVISSGQFQCAFQTHNGVSYTVQFTDSLAPVNWQTLTNLTGNGSLAGITDGNLGGSERFYRVAAQ